VLVMKDAVDREGSGDDGRVGAGFESDHDWSGLGKQKKGDM